MDQARDDQADSEKEARSTSAQAREGATRAETEPPRGRDQAVVAEEDPQRTDAERMGGTDPGIDAGLGGPGRMDESIDLAEVAPDGSSFGRGLTSPTGEAIGGGIADSIEGRAAGLGGSSLGRGLNFDPASASNERDLGRALSAQDGSSVSAVPRDPATGMPMGRDRDLDPPSPPTNRADDPNWDGPVDEKYPTNRFEDPNYDGSDEQAPPMTGRDQDPTDEEQGDDIVGPGYAQPDPTGGDDVITGESVAAAVKAHAAGGDPGIFRPTEEAAMTGYATNLADNDPDNITNYGPDGPQSAEGGANWAPPADLLFDPPPEGGSAGMAGAGAAMADPGAALGGSMIGSSTPDEAPPPPDPPPGEDTGGGPLGPPGGDGEG